MTTGRIHNVQETFYRLGRMNFLFMAASGALLASILWMVWEDYDRPWKGFQRVFQGLELAQARDAYRTYEEQAHRDAIAELERRIEAARAAQGSGDPGVVLDGVEREIATREAEMRLAEQSRNFETASLNEMRHHLEVMLREGDAGSGPLAEAIDARASSVAALTSKVQEMEAALGDLTARRDALRADVTALEEELAARRLEADGLAAKIEELDPREFLNVLGRAARDAPGLDFIRPTLTIGDKQIVVSNVRETRSFLSPGVVTVDKVDRCMTCHVGILDESFALNASGDAFADAALARHMEATFANDEERLAYTRVLAAHPRMDLLAGSASPHPADVQEPLKNFGCTTCHGGRGRGTDFTWVAHTPDSAQERDRWERLWGHHELHETELWTEPMLPSQHVEASCYTCHRQDRNLAGADRWEQGRTIFERAGCYACHKVAGYEDEARPGPDLTHLGDKVSDPEWVAAWIKNPHAFRPGTTMPRFFGLANAGTGPEAAAREDTQIRAIAAYLYSHARSRAYGEPPAGDPAAGERVVRDVGCLACHRIGEEAGNGSRWDERAFGPDLSRVGEKATGAWLYQWVRDPKHYFTDGQMPNLTLSESEAADVAAYLGTLRTPEAGLARVGPVDPTYLTGTVREILSEARAPSEVDACMAEMDEPARLRFLGQSLIQRYGCASCHAIEDPDPAEPWFPPAAPGGRIPGAGLFTDAQRIGKELSEEGNLIWEDFDFGLWQEHIERAPHAWLERKIRDPRLFDMIPGDPPQVRPKVPKDLLRMPSFAFSEDDAQALTTFILSLRSGSQIGVERLHVPQGGERAWESSERILAQNNCVSCHQIGLDELVFETREIRPGGKSAEARTFVVAGDFSLDWQAVADGDDAEWSFTPRWGWDSFDPDRGYWPLLRRDGAGVPVGEGLVQLFGGGELFPVGTLPGDSLRAVRLRGGTLPEDRIGDLQAALRGIAGADLRIDDDRSGRFLWHLALEKLRQERFDVDDPEGLAEGMAGFDVSSHLARTAPPNLFGVGAKMNPEWLYGFLRNPRPGIRTGAVVRMPVFQARREGDAVHGLTDEEIATLVEGFAWRSALPFPARDFYDRTAWGSDAAQARSGPLAAARAAVFNERDGCRLCHTIGPVGTPQANLADRGPDLSRAGARLRPQYLVAWLRDPSLLKPGTAMPMHNWTQLGTTPEDVALFLYNLSYPEE